MRGARGRVGRFINMNAFFIVQALVLRTLQQDSPCALERIETPLPRRWRDANHADRTVLVDNLPEWHLSARNAC